MPLLLGPQEVGQGSVFDGFGLTMRYMEQKMSKEDLLYLSLHKHEVISRNERVS